MMRNGYPLHNAGGRSRLEMDRASACCFSLTKVDSETGASLSGARFMLTEMSVGTRQTNVSNEMGIVSFAVQPCHSYVLREITPPPGYVIDATIYIISIDRCGQAMINNRREIPFIVGNLRVASLFSIVYSANGGIGGYVETGLVEGSTYIIKSPEQVGISFPDTLRQRAQANGAFTGWNTAPNGSGTTYQPGEAVIVTRDLTLYAQWQPTSSFSVAYDANGGVGAYVSSGIPGGSLYTILSPAETGISRSGYAFVGWNTSPDGTGASFVPGSQIPVAENLTLYARWLLPTLFTITYDANGAEGGEVSIPLEAGAIFTVGRAEDQGFEDPGATFTNWNTEPDGSGMSFLPGDEIIVENDILLYAQWEPIGTFSAIYDPNGGEGGHIDGDLLPGAFYTILTPAEAGISHAALSFAGWNTESGGTGTPYFPGNLIMIEGDLVLYAQWEAVQSFTIAYDANGGEGGSSISGLPAGTGYTISTPEQADVSHPDLTFVAWNTDPFGEGSAYAPDDIITVEGDMTLYAQWEAAGVFFVIYDANNGEGDYVDENLEPASYYTVLAPEDMGISRAGYDFISWNIAPDGSDEGFEPGDTFIIVSDMLLYAQWEENII